MIISGRTGYARNNRDTIRSLKRFYKKPVLHMREINVTFLDKYEVFLRSRGGSNGVIGETLEHQSVLTTKAYVREFGVEVLDEAVEALLW